MKNSERWGYQKSKILYIPGPKDQAWMEQADREYVWHLERMGQLDSREPNLRTEVPRLYAEVIANRRKRIVRLPVILKHQMIELEKNYVMGDDLEMSLVFTDSSALIEYGRSSSLTLLVLRQYKGTRAWCPLNDEYVSIISDLKNTEVISCEDFTVVDISRWPSKLKRHISGPKMFTGSISDSPVLSFLNWCAVYRRAVNSNYFFNDYLENVVRPSLCRFSLSKLEVLVPSMEKVKNMIEGKKIDKSWVDGLVKKEFIAPHSIMPMVQELFAIDVPIARQVRPSKVLCK